MRSVLVIIMIILTSCAATRYQVRPDQQRPAFNGKVLVYERQVPSDVKYVVIGDYVEQKEWYGGTGETADEATRVAASRGANGILIERTGHRVTGFSWAAPYTEGKLLWIANHAAASGGLVGPAGSATTAQRLRELDDLHQQGLITDKEYKEKKEAILKSL